MRHRRLGLGYASVLSNLLLLSACGGVDNSDNAHKPNLDLNLNQNQQAQTGETLVDTAASTTPAPSDSGVETSPSDPNADPSPGEPEQGRCSGLSEADCVNAVDCEPIYRSHPCPTLIACDPTIPGDCPVCEAFFSCVDVTNVPPPPSPPSCPADPCADLEESTCLENPGCQPIYGGTDCVCTCELPNPTDCPLCDCAPTDFFAGCVSRDPCVDLDERTCNATPGCEPIYGDFCPVIRDDSGDADPVPPSCQGGDMGFLGCTSDSVCGDPVQTEPAPAPEPAPEPEPGE